MESSHLSSLLAVFLCYFVAVLCVDAFVVPQLPCSARQSFRSSLPLHSSSRRHHDEFFWGKERSHHEIETHISERLASIDHTDNNNNNVQCQEQWTTETVHVLSAEPLLVVIHDFLSTSMCDTLIQAAKDSDKNMARSTTGNSKKISKSRTSSTLWLKDKECPEPSRLIAEKVSSISGLPPSCMENLQVCRYEQGQEFNVHTDHQDNFNDLEFGGRLATCLIYLAEPDRGGQTFFPELDNTKIPVTKGSAVFFWNTMEKPGSVDYKPDMFLHTDMRMQHAGLPVEEGEKWICNRWIHPVDFPAGVRGFAKSSSSSSSSSLTAC